MRLRRVRVAELTNRTLDSLVAMRRFWETSFVIRWSQFRETEKVVSLSK